MGLFKKEKKQDKTINVVGEKKPLTIKASMGPKFSTTDVLLAHKDRDKKLNALCERLGVEPLKKQEETSIHHWIVFNTWDRKSYSFDEMVNALLDKMTETATRVEDKPVDIVVIQK